jgi:hypothetical protein
MRKSVLWIGLLAIVATGTAVAQAPCRETTSPDYRAGEAGFAWDAGENFLCCREVSEVSLIDG